MQDIYRDMAKLRKRLRFRGYTCVSVQYDPDADLVDIHFRDEDFNVYDEAVSPLSVPTLFKCIITRRGLINQ